LESLASICGSKALIQTEIAKVFKENSKTHSQTQTSCCSQLALFLLLTGLKKVRKVRLFGRGDLLVWVGLAIEFESLIGVCEVLLRLFFDFSVGLNPIKKLGAVARIFGHSSLISFKGFVMPSFLLQGRLPAATRQILFKQDSCAGKSSGVKNSAPIIIAMLAILLRRLIFSICQESLGC